MSIGTEVIERMGKPFVEKTSGSGRAYVRELKRVALRCGDVVHTVTLLSIIF